MPFDVATETLAIRRTRLAMELRKGVRYWNFTNMNCCAMPVAKKLFGSGYRKALGLTTRQYRQIFGFWQCGHSFFYGCPTSNVTPAMVADALEEIE